MEAQIPDKLMREQNARNQQQEQTLEYFRKSAEDWRNKAEGKPSAQVNVIKQRNDYVLFAAQTRDSLDGFLDVGCGSGELALAMAARGIRSVGVDFAPEMIRLAQEKAQSSGGSQVQYVAASIFEYAPGDNRFGLISANGFIEYISSLQLSDFLNLTRSLLDDAGELVLGSRNRLFNLSSLNDFTRLEMAGGASAVLLEEALTVSGATDMEACIAQLAALESAFPTVEQHPNTGIDVQTRYQYTPGQLVRLLTEKGYQVIDLYPIHYHGAVPRFVRDHPKVHVMMANLMQEFAAGRHYLLPYASSFMIRARKH